MSKAIWLVLMVCCAVVLAPGCGSDHACRTTRSRGTLPGGTATRALPIGTSGRPSSSTHPIPGIVTRT